MEAPRYVTAASSERAKGEQSRSRGRKEREISREYAGNEDECEHRCPNCGLESHPREECPARGQRCYECGGIGHFAAPYRGETSNQKPTTSAEELKSSAARQRGGPAGGPIPA